MVNHPHFHSAHCGYKVERNGAIRWEKIVPLGRKSGVHGDWGVWLLTVALKGVQTELVEHTLQISMVGEVLLSPSPEFHANTPFLHSPFSNNTGCLGNQKRSCRKGKNISLNKGHYKGWTQPA